MAEELMSRPVTELAALVREGQLTARELVADSLARIEQREPQVGAFVDVFAQDALREAAAIGPGDPRPFAGVPIAIKNNRPVAGRRLTFGAALMGDFVARRDASVVRRLRAAGFVVVGTTRLPEWGILPVTETARFGPTRNPWDLTRTPGGSSGGSAAAVAAGMVPIAHANDGGGSTRIPAACCGLVGLKPQRGRISIGPDGGYPALVQDGVLTRTVAETAVLLDVLAGREPGDPAWAPEPPEPFAVAAARPPHALRVALTTTPALESAALDPVHESATRRAAALLADLGHEVEELDAPWQEPGLLDAFAGVFGPPLAALMAWAGSLSGRLPEAGDVEPLSWWVWEQANALNAWQAVAADARLNAFTRRVARWALPYDAILTPALAEPPVALGTIDGGDPADPAATFARSGRFTPYAAIANVTGDPAVVVPVAVRPDDDAVSPGLPVGVQLIGRPAQEGALLALAGQLEQAAAVRLAPSAAIVDR